MSKYLAVLMKELIVTMINGNTEICLMKMSLETDKLKQSMPVMVFIAH